MFSTVFFHHVLCAPRSIGNATRHENDGVVVVRPSFRYQEQHHCSLAVASAGVSAIATLNMVSSTLLGFYLLH
jgi:hypothetical protein